ncbi:MAG: DUF3726 domain-containing protein, partial [Hyphomicrobiales bacterium]
MSLDLSIGETESLVLKACRGAGMTWGVSEDASRVAGFLARQGVDGFTAFASLLTKNDGLSFDKVAPAESEGVWHARGGTLCPVAAGCLMSDLTYSLKGDCDFELADLSYPIIFIGFLGLVAQRSAQVFQASDGTTSTVCSADGLRDAEKFASVPRVSSFIVKSSDASNGPCAEKTLLRAHCPQDAFDTLSKFAHRIYV